MDSRRFRLVLGAVLFASGCVQRDTRTIAREVRHDFDTWASGTPCRLLISDAGPGPTLEEGAVRMLHGLTDEVNALVFDSAVSSAPARVSARVRFRMREGADGWCFALLDAATYGPAGPIRMDHREWEAPSLSACFGVGVDVHSPPTRDPFSADGNVYDRPQRELSLHWDGLELVKVCSPVEFRDSDWHDLGVAVAFTVGGADVSVSVDDSSVLDGFFVPDMRPFRPRVLLGARTGGLSTDLWVDDVQVAFDGPGPRDDTPPVAVPVFVDEPVHGGRREPGRTVALPNETGAFGRCLLDLVLDPAPGGCDPWDKSAAVYVWTPDGERFELVRFITPYGRPYVWTVDVTDFLPLLSGVRRFGLFVDTWMPETDDPAQQKGWQIGVTLRYIPGPDQQGLRAFAVRNLWQGEPDYGNPERPIDEFFRPLTVQVPEDARGASLRLMVTGHGQHPNTDNAAEFLPSDRTLTVGDRVWRDRLWKQDCYLNPCRPQGGTWKYDRAGWAPGAVVTPWEIDVTDQLRPGGVLAVDYEAMPYTNHNRDQGRAFYWVESQIVFRR